MSWGAFGGGGGGGEVGGGEGQPALLHKYKSCGAPCRAPKLITGHQNEFVVRCI